jgi:hypothetical protein
MCGLSYFSTTKHKKVCNMLIQILLELPQKLLSSSVSPSQSTLPSHTFSLARQILWPVYSNVHGNWGATHFTNVLGVDVFTGPKQTNLCVLNRQLFRLYELNKQRFPTFGLYLKFGLFRILVYSGFCLCRISGLFRVLSVQDFRLIQGFVYAGFLVYSGFYLCIDKTCINRKSCINKTLNKPEILHRQNSE